MRQYEAVTRVFGERVRTMRLEAGLSEDELALQCGLVTIEKIETGRREPRLSEILMLCNGLGVSPARLLEDLQISELGRDELPES